MPNTASPKSEPPCGRAVYTPDCNFKGENPPHFLKKGGLRSLLGGFHRNDAYNLINFGVICPLNDENLGGNCQFRKMGKSPIPCPRYNPADLSILFRTLNTGTVLVPAVVWVHLAPSHHLILKFSWPSSFIFRNARGPCVGNNGLKMCPT